MIMSGTMIAARVESGHSMVTQDGFPLLKLSLDSTGVNSENIEYMIQRGIVEETFAAGNDDTNANDFDDEFSEDFNDTNEDENSNEDD